MIKVLSEEMATKFKFNLHFQSRFLHCLAMHARYIPTTCNEAGFTDGINIYYNPFVLSEFTERERSGLFLHELLHCVLKHLIRVGTRDRKIWNISADIYINNGVIKNLSWCSMHSMFIDKPEYLRPSVEEIYSLLVDLKDKKEEGLTESEKEDKEWLNQTLESFDCDLRESDNISKESDPLDKESDKPYKAERNDSSYIERYWDKANKSSQSIKDKGSIPNTLLKELQILSEPQLNWREALSHFLVSYPCDFNSYDRRFIHLNQYNDYLEGEKLHVYVCIDTSGSINDKQLGLFTTELEAILNAFTYIEVTLYFADCELDGPYCIKEIKNLPPIKGGGGTSFVPFFKEIEEHVTDNKIAVYLTDGYGYFPEETEVETIWVVTPGGENKEKFPFGNVIQLVY